MKYECAYMINERGTTLLWSQGDSARFCYVVVLPRRNRVGRLFAANTVLVELYWKSSLANNDPSSLIVFFCPLGHLTELSWTLETDIAQNTLSCWIHLAYISKIDNPHHLVLTALCFTPAGRLSCRRSSGNVFPPM